MIFKKSPLSMFHTMSFIISLLLSCSTGITGVVLDLEERPIFSPHAKVNIVRISEAENEMPSQIVELDDNGTFENIEALEPGEYLIEPLVPGYRAISIRTKLDQSVHLRIQMDPIKTTGPSAIRPNMNVKLGRGAGSANLTPPNY